MFFSVLSISRPSINAFVILLLWFWTLSAVAFAQARNTLPEPLRQVGIDQRLNEQVPLNLIFREEAGKVVQLSDYVKTKPTILALVYYECPMLCTLVLNGLLKSLRALAFDVGDQFEIVVVSFDPRETPALAAAKKKEYLQRYGRAGAADGWHFLTGDEAAIRQLTQAVGFRYAYDTENNQFIHASGIIILTPQGRIARYFYGIEYTPRDVRLGLIEAAANKIGSPIDQILLFCYHYDPETGKYNLLIMNVLRLAGFATVLSLGAFMIVMLRRDRCKNYQSEPRASGQRR